MPIYSFKTIKQSEKSAHQRVEINDCDAGEVWREQVRVVVGKHNTSSKTVMKWRWFAKREGETTVIGRGTRSAVLLGAGFSSKQEAAEKLYTGREAVFK